MWWPADWLTPLYPSQLNERTWMPCRSSAAFATAPMSSPIRPTGQVAQIETARGWKISTTSSIIFASFFSPPKTMSLSCMSVVKQSWEKICSGGVVASALALFRRVPQL